MTVPRLLRHPPVLPTLNTTIIDAERRVRLALNGNNCMNKPVLIAIASLAVSAICARPIMSAEVSPAEQEIRQAAKDFADDYNNGDAKAVAAHWTNDGEYMVGQMNVKGRDAIEKLYADFLRAHPGSKMAVKVDSVRVLAPTVAIENGSASVSDSPNVPNSSSLYSAVDVKQNGKWLLVSVREPEVPTVHLDRDIKELAWMIGDWSAGKDGKKATLSCDWMNKDHFLRAKVTVEGKNGQFPGGAQVIGRDPVSGRIVSWFFSADGGYGTGLWQKEGSRWFIQTTGITADGTPTAATNVLYHADKDVASWQSFNRFRGNVALPDVKEIVIERASAKN
jgi:uncharacterized protein (TIGR02246 family)